MSITAVLCELRAELCLVTCEY